jgi:hypothetical protein
LVKVAALTYYYDHRDAMDTALVASYAQAEQQRHHHTPHPKLVAARAAGGVMLRLYMDVHIKAAITAGLRRRGIDVVTAQEDGGAHLEDMALLDRATALQRGLFSQDDDLLAIGRDVRLRVCCSPGSYTDINSPPPWASMYWIWRWSAKCWTPRR